MRVGSQNATEFARCDGPFTVTSNGMRGNFFAEAMRLIYDGFGFFIREVDHAVQLAVRRKVVVAVGVVFDPIRAIHHLFTNGLPRPVDSINVLHPRWNFQLP